MIKCTVYPNKQKLSGEINASPSKSQTLRAILFASLAKGTSIIDNILLSPDATAMIVACEQLGAKITKNNQHLCIIGTNGNLKTPDNVIDAGNSGIVLRFIASICSVLNNYCIITGDYSIRHNRPIKPLLDGLNRLGVFAESARGDDFSPIIIKGPVLFNESKLDGQDSQPISGLIISSLLTKGDTHINVTNPGEKPWVDLTLNWLDRLNLRYTREGYDKFIIPGVQKINSFEYYVPSDLSSISFPIAAALVTNSSIVINNVDLTDPQGDKKFLDICRQMGASIDYDQYTRILKVNHYDRLVGIDININDCIDVISILSVLACFAEGKTRITGAKIARNKECDRVSAIATELMRMGANLNEFEDGIEIYHSLLMPTENLQTYNDHRMVMALFVAALGAVDNSLSTFRHRASRAVSRDFSSLSGCRGQAAARREVVHQQSLSAGYHKIIINNSVILDIKSVSKSYPDFFIHMQELGINFVIE